MRKGFKITMSWRCLAGQRGASGAEFAVVLPVMALILIGLITALRYFYAEIATITAADDCAVMASQAGSVPANMAMQRDQAAYGQPFNGNVVGFSTASSKPDSCLVENHATFTSLTQTIFAYFTYPVQRYHSDWSGHAAPPAPSTWP
jgi:Flp pilus assembly protein TadG